jgi:hypothetical protein
MTDKNLSELKSAVKSHRAEAEQSKAFNDGAKTTMILYESYLAAGFKEEQALYLTATMITANIKK